jgi:class 3 adenylate cyclase
VAEERRLVTVLNRGRRRLDGAGRGARPGGHAIRLGLSTGEVVAATGRGSGDFLITGDAVNGAARLQQGAEISEIVCGSAPHVPPARAPVPHSRVRVPRSSAATRTSHSST